MKQIMLVFGYTFRDAVKKKAFVISTVIILALILILSMLPRGIEFFSQTDDDGTQSAEKPAETQESPDDLPRCYYIDENGLIADGSRVLSEVLGGVSVTEGTEGQLDAYREEIRKDGDVSAVWITEQDGRPYLHVICKDFMSGISSGDVTDALSNACLRQELAKQGLDEKAITAVTAPLNMEVEAVGELDLTGYVLGIIFTMLMFFAIYYYGYGVAMSVATEKTSRVMETLVVSAKPSRILLGKCLAMGALGLLQFAGVILFSVICAGLFLPEGFTIMGAELSLSALTPYTVLFLLAYFVLGYSLFAMLNAVCGASVSKVEDLNSAMMPVSVIAVLSFYLGYFTTITSSENGMLQKIAMYLPFSSPFMVPSRLLNGGIGTKEMLISLGILLVSIVLLALISIRIYSASVLHYGKRQNPLKIYQRNS